MRKALLVLAAAALVSGAAASTAAASHSWGSYHWARTANPFTLKLGDNVTGTWDGYLGTASSDWSKSTVLDTSIVAGQSTKRCRATSGRVEVCNGTYGNNGWLGVAQIWASGSHITQGTVKVNDTYFNTATYNNSGEKEHTMCQEVGHTLGLTHTSEDGSSQATCMDYSASSETNHTSSHPNSHDYAQLSTIYSHLDSTTTLNRSAQPGAEPTAVSRTDRISDSTISETFADGSQRITHVLWTTGR